MPTDSENIHYLYLVLTHDGPPTIDWAPVGAAMDLKPGAVSKRWSRLKQSMEKGETPPASNYPFLWLCVKHNKRDKVPNWNEIAAKCNTTSGAASKRYSRMKQAFEQDVPPATSSPVKNTPSKLKIPSTPKYKKTSAGTGENGDDDRMLTPTPTPKRKRASPTKKKIAVAEEKDISEPESNDYEDDAGEYMPKRTKSTKTTTPNPKRKAKLEEIEVPVETTSDREGTVKREMTDETDAFYDAQEHVGGEEVAVRDDDLPSWLEESV
ncbi:hypothetical protein NX059_000726 [Plenodomus lindquistii]|nr:hypothetical protein NX059_000726 [Plenodomus lindquistii]